MQKITVRNFRQITEAEVEIKKILVLIGEQASGKSTLAKLIYFFKSLKDDYFNLIYENANGAETELEKMFIQRIIEKFNLYFGPASNLNHDFEITFHYRYLGGDNPENRSLKLAKGKGLGVSFDYGFFGEILSNTRDLARQIADFDKAKPDTDINSYRLAERTKARFIRELGQRVDALFRDDHSPMFFPAGRSITVAYPEHFQTLFFGNINSPESLSRSADLLQMKAFMLHSKFLNDYFNKSSFEEKIGGYSGASVSAHALGFFKAHSEYILQGRYENANGGERLVFGNHPSHSVPFSLASSGQQESIRIIQDLFYLLYENQKSFRVIEEPEAHLYPLAQKKLVELISLVANCTQSQIALTTHSPYILSILNNLLMLTLTEQRNPASTGRIHQHFGTGALLAEKNERINLRADEVQAYALKPRGEVYCASLIDPETGLIGENYLDRVTEELNADFNLLYELNFQSA